MIGRILLGLGIWTLLAVAICALRAAISRGLERRRYRNMVDDLLFEAEVCRHPVLRPLFLPEDLS